jgi:hypothetical protein
MIFCLLSLGYESTRTSSMIGMPIRLHDTTTILRYSELGGCATLPQPEQF